MANKKFTDLPQADTITGAEVLAMVQDGDSVQGDIDLIKSYFDARYPTMVYTAPASVTPTFTGFGSVTGINARTWRLGSELWFEITFTAGTTTATEARIGLRYNPGSGEVDATTVSNYPTLQACGIMLNGANTNQFSVMAEASKTYIVFGLVLNGAFAGLVKRNGDVIASSGNVISVKGSVRINGW